MDLCEAFGEVDPDVLYERMGERLFVLWWARERVKPRRDHLVEWLFAQFAAVAGHEMAEKLFYPRGFPDPDTTPDKPRPQSVADVMRVLRKYGNRARKQKPADGK